MAKELSNIKKVGLALTVACLLGGQVSAWNLMASKEEPKEEKTTKGVVAKVGVQAGKALEAIKGTPAKVTGFTKEKVVPFVKSNRTLLGVLSGAAAVIITQWLYQTGKVNYIVNNDPVLAGEIEGIEARTDLSVEEKVEERQKAVARRVAEYFADETLLDTFMKSGQGVWSIAF